MDIKNKIYIAGHKGMVGSAIWRKLEAEGYTNLIGRTSSELDLRNQGSVDAFFKQEKPEVVIDAAARVGGILANRDHPYEFLMENLQIQNNLIETSHKNEVQKFIFLGSSCIYPKHAPQPLKEEYLLTGPLEPTNEAYAIAKIAGLKACEAIKRQYDKDFISLMPTNLYGPNDNFDLESSHVLPAMLRKFHEAKINGNKPVVLWGSGKPLREFLYVDDLADAVHFVLEHQLSESYYNVGTGREISIEELAFLIQGIAGHRGEIRWDESKPDGTPRKLLDVSRLKGEGWSARTSLEGGVSRTYLWYVNG
ncbi:GDP-L-fucose synthase family protein [Salegentibacter sp. F14]